MICIRDARMDYKRLVTIYTNFARNSYGTDKIVELVDVGSEYKALKVAGFTTIAEVDVFLKDVMTKSFLTRDYERREHYMWNISEENFDKLIQNGLVQAYSDFYKSNY